MNVPQTPPRQLYSEMRLYRTMELQFYHFQLSAIIFIIYYCTANHFRTCSDRTKLGLCIIQLFLSCQSTLTIFN